MYSKLLNDELKKKFNHDFKVRKKKGDSYVVEYVDGPREENVLKFLSKYEYGYFDGMTDSYVYNNEGGIAKYILVYRRMSDKVKEDIIKEIKEEYGNNITDLPYSEQHKIIGRYIENEIDRRFRERNYN